MVKEQKKILGRWTIDNCNKKINIKIDNANRDHCGNCGNYDINKNEIKKDKL